MYAYCVCSWVNVPTITMQRVVRVVAGVLRMMSVVGVAMLVGHLQSRRTLRSNNMAYYIT